MGFGKSLSIVLAFHICAAPLLQEAILQAGAQGASDSDIIEYLKRHRPG